MEAATVLVDAGTASALESQAEALTNRARSLREQADDLMREAMRMRTDAERIRKPHIYGPVRLLRPAVARAGRNSDDAALLGQIIDALDGQPPITSTVLADQLG